MACDMSSLRAVSTQVSCAGQPDEQWLELLSLSGVKWVINLGMAEAEYSLVDEAQRVASLGMDYRHIPVAFDAPQIEKFEAFCQAMSQCGEEPIFVHCAVNKRASCFVALWMEQTQGWVSSEGDHLIHSVWQPDEVWQQFIEVVRGQH